MSNSLRVLITGHNGYIGSVLAPIFQAAGHTITGLDTCFYRECTLVPDRQTAARTITKDIRDLETDDLKGYDAVVHLAALSNDPIGNLNDGWTEDINFKASVKLAELARAAGVGRFLFSSSCIMYGASSMAVVNEESPLDPLTEYARSKVKAEVAIRELATPTFSPVFLRNGTVYGVSPRMRFDTVFNDLVGSAIAFGKTTVHSGGKPWRPVLHVEDVSRAFLAVLEAPRDAIHNQAFNVGADNLNQQIIQLAELAVKAVPNAELSVLNTAGADQRTYWTDFSKFARTFPEFEFRWTPEKGGKQLYESLSGAGLTAEQFTNRKFTRIKWLKHLLETEQLDGSLRWQPTALTATA